MGPSLGQLAVPGAFARTPGKDFALLAGIAKLGECKPGAVGGYLCHLVGREPTTIPESRMESWRKMCPAEIVRAPGPSHA